MLALGNPFELFPVIPDQTLKLLRFRSRLVRAALVLWCLYTLHDRPKDINMRRQFNSQHCHKCRLCSKLGRARVTQALPAWRESPGEGLVPTLH